MVSSQKALHPRYAERFQCVGSACEDTCCRSWQIPIDRQTFDRYRALPEGPLTPIFAASLVLRIHAAPASERQADGFHGQINLLPDGACPFLSAENLCRIHAELGKDHLSQVCAAFPRTTRTIDSHPETSLQLSCPEAARQVLLNRRFMHLPRTAPRGHARYTPFLGVAASLEPPHGNPFQYFMEIRHLLFLILKDRSYPLWQRLFIVGLFSKRLTEVLDGSRQTAGQAAGQSTVPMLLRSYAELMQQGRLRSVMDAIPGAQSVPSRSGSSTAFRSSWLASISARDARSARSASPARRRMPCTCVPFWTGSRSFSRTTCSATSSETASPSATIWPPMPPPHRPGRSSP